MSSSWEILTIGSWRRTRLKKYGSKAPLKKKLRNLRGRLQRFQSWLRGLESMKLQKMCLTILIRKVDGSNNEIRNYVDSCPLCKDSEGASQVFVSPDFSSSFLHVFFRASCIAICTDGQWRWKSIWITSRSGKRTSVPWPVIALSFHIYFVNVPYVLLHYFGQNKLSGTILPILT